VAVIDQCINDKFAIYNADCMEVLPTLPSESVGVSVYSPPFPELYQYSNDPRDMSNCTKYEEGIDQYRFVVEQVARLTKRGRLTCVHAMELKRGSYFNRDFPGDIVRVHEEFGFNYICRVTIWKDPWLIARRTRLKSLRHKNICDDSATVRIGPADYVLIFKKGWENPERITHPDGLKTYAGSTPIPEELVKKYKNYKGDQKLNKLSHWIWRKYASPVWDDIRTGRLLPHLDAKDSEEEKHVCLARGSLVLTRDGHRPIEEVAVGDMVLTHRGRWRPVTAVAMTGIKECVQVKAHGVPNLIVTPDHKLWTRIATGHATAHRRTASQCDPLWVRADELVRNYVNLKLPPIEESRLTKSEWWLVGRWIADGHRGARGDYHVSIGKEKLSHFQEMAGDHAGTSRELDAVQIRLKDLSPAILAVLAQCGDGAQNKRIPMAGLALDADHAASLLDGYLSGDGYFLAERNRWMASSVSRELLLGVAMLSQRVYGAIACVFAGRAPGTATIDGRAVNTRQDWILSFNKPCSSRRLTPFILDDGSWKKVRSVDAAGTHETWCLRVEEDESFTAEGCIVKNCPPQLDVIERCLTLYSNPDDIVLTPFMGVGSEVFMANAMGRRALGIELKPTYYRQALANLQPEVIEKFTDSEESALNLFTELEAAS